MKVKQKQTTKQRFIVISLLIFSFFSSHLYAQDEQQDTIRRVELESVGITWTRPGGEELFSSTYLSKDDIKNSQGNGSINNLFDCVPSMVSTSDAGTGLGHTYMRIRGIDQTRINVTINGIALNDAESQGSWFVNLPDFGSYVQSLDVQRGVGTSNNGAAAFGATMNFTTQQENREPFLEFTSAVGSFKTFRNNISAGTGLIKNRLTATIGYSNIQSKGYIDRGNVNLNSLYFNTTYRLFNKKKSRDFGKLALNILYGNEKTGQTWNGVPSDSLKTNRRYNSCGEYYDNEGKVRYYENETDNYEQTHYQLFYSINRDFINEKKKHTIRFNAGGHLTRGIGYYESYRANKKFTAYGLENLIILNDTIKKTDFIDRKYLDNYFYGGTFNFEHQITNIENEKLKNSSLTWSLGGALNHYDGDHYGTIIWTKYAKEIPINYRWYNGKGSKLQANIFGTLSYNINDKLFSYLDLQYRYIDYKISGTEDKLTDIGQQYRWNFFNPKIGINYSWKSIGKLSAIHAFYGSFAIANREPTRADLVDSPNDKKPVPETLFDLEVGYRLKSSLWSFNANLYYMHYHNQLILTGEINNTGAAIMTNAKTSYRAGIELVSYYQPVKFFLWKINSTFSTNKILNYTEFIDDWDTGVQRQKAIGLTNISFSPNIILTNELHFTIIKKIKISAITKFVSKQYLDNSSNDNYILKPYSTTNLNFSYQLQCKAISQIEFFFYINNIFNTQYESNAWLYRYYEEGIEKFQDGYFAQAGINVLGGIKMRF